MDLEALKIDRTPRERGPGRRRSARSPWLGRGIGLALLAGLVWLFWTPILAQVDKLRLPSVRIYRVVETHPAAAGAVSGTSANGYVVAARRAALSADTPGRIVEVLVTEGSVVSQGDVVARIFADEYAAAVRRTAAEKGSAEAGLVRAQALRDAATTSLEQAERTRDAAAADLREAESSQALAALAHERVTKLVAGGIASQRELDEAQAGLDGANARVAAAEARHAASERAVAASQARAEVADADVSVANAQIAVATAAAEQAAATLDKTEVRAPFDGVVVLKDAEVGEVVSPNSQGGSNARGSICTMVDFDSLEVQVDLPETSLASVAKGGRANIYLDSYPDKLYRGRVDRIWPTADRQKATVEVRVRFRERDDLLRPDMGARVVFVSGGGGGEAGVADASTGGDATSDALIGIVIPERALVTIDGTDGAFVLERDVVRFTKLEIGERRNGRALVEDGLDPGQQLVLEPPSSLQDGDRVRIEGS